jgi:threonyl-tRNA synthetase
MLSKTLIRSTLLFCPCLHGNTDLLIVVGQEELDNRSVNVRNRDDVGTKAKTAMIPFDTIMDKLVKLKASRSLQNTLPE